MIRISVSKHCLALLLLGTNFQIATASNYEVTNLVADLVNIAPHTDPNLINPWGLFFVPNGNFWVADNGSNLSTLYRPDGSIINFVINVPAAPTGTVRNSSTHAFIIGGSMNPHPASFLFATENGTILGFNTAVDLVNAVIATDRSSFEAIYKGIEIASTCCGQKMLYATDFHNGKIDIFDSNFHFLNSTFTPTIPAGFAPFNIKFLNGLLYVTYAKQLPPENKDDERGLGNGFVAIFTVYGAHVKNLVSQGSLNSPWGLALAPETFGDLSGALLVGNFGDGLIHAYDKNTGAFLGQLTDKMGNPIQIDGLWTLEFDSKGNLYFTSGPNGENNGLVGMISLAP